MARTLSFQQIEALRAVVLCGTTVAAARMLHTTQPTISRLIGQAQQATQLKLFFNDRGRLHLTREGKFLFEAIQRHFLGLDEIEKSAESLRASGAGVFRIASTPSLAQSVLPAAIKSFLRERPDTHLQIHTLGSREIAEGISQSLYDIAVTNSPLIGGEFDCEKIHESEAVFIEAADDVEEDLETDFVEISELMGKNMIRLPSNDPLEMIISNYFSEKNIEHPRKIETIYTSTICTLVEQGVGVAVVNPFMASAFRGKIRIRRFVPRIGVTTYLGKPSFGYRSELSERFSTAVISEITSQRWKVGNLTTATPTSLAGC